MQKYTPWFKNGLFGSSLADEIDKTNPLILNSLIFFLHTLQKKNQQIIYEHLTSPSRYGMFAYHTGGQLWLE
jgi:hypothetical protein